MSLNLAPKIAQKVIRISGTTEIERNPSNELSRI